MRIHSPPPPVARRRRLLLETELTPYEGDNLPRAKEAEASGDGLDKNMASDNDSNNELSSHSPHAQATEVDQEAHDSGTDIQDPLVSHP